MVSVRPASLEEAAAIGGHRRAMFSDMGYGEQTALDTMTTAFIPWVQAKMIAGEYLAWFAVSEDGEVAAGVGLWLMDWPPHMIGSGKRRGNILNVYTRPEFRRQGLARKLTETAVEWCRSHGIKTVILHASDQGRDLYRSLGFEPTNEMRRLLYPCGALRARSAACRRN
ncbi:MAG: GNAT family N-acetyltransferase [Ignavibacteriota bacterium]